MDTANSLLTAKELALALEEIATLLELKGENPFKIRAYTAAARTLSALTMPLSDFIDAIAAHQVKGFGPAITEKVTILYQTGSLPYLEELRGGFPTEIRQLLQVPGLGAKKVKILFDELKIASIADLERACNENKVAALKGFGDKTQQKILQGITQFRNFSDQYLLIDARNVGLAVLERLQSSGLATKVELAGSLRRSKEVVRDIDLLAASKTPKKLMELFVSHPLVGSVTAHGETKSSIVLSNGIAADLRVVSDTEFPAALQYFSGSKEHNTIVRGIAKKKGLKLNEYGLFKGEKALRLSSEEELYHALGLAFIPPEARENQGEIELAQKLFSEGKSFPQLVSAGDIKGILHAHTTYSDGKNTLAELAVAVRDFGYEYLGVSDHSQSAAYAGGLRVEAIKRQHEEIDELNQKLAPFIIFKGIESDILADGSLDYLDSVLESFDFVIASVHSRFGMSEDEMTSRIIRAASNPFTTILGHMTGRLLLQREGYPLDVRAVLETCATHGVAVELNANPRRFDLDWRFLRLATELKIPIPINPDAHAIDQVPFVNLGVGIARKGWLTSAQVLNCRDARAMQEFFHARKRSRGQR